MNVELRQSLEEREIPLLSTSQLQFLDEVSTVVDSKLSYDDSWYLPEDDERAYEVMLQISALEEDLGLIIKHLRGGMLAKLRFAETYPKFKKNREDCIVQLEEIASSINSDRFNCNVSKLVGYSTSLVGGAVTLASAILIPFTLGLSTPLAIGGGITMAAGAGTAIATSVTEVVLLKSKVDRAKLLIEEDQKYFVHMSDWLNRASELQQALSDVLNIDVFKDISEAIKKFVEDGIAIKNNNKRKKFIECTISQIIRSFLPRFVEISVPVIGIATVISVLVTVFLLLINNENRLVFDCASLTIRSILGVISLMDDAMDFIKLSRLFAGSAMAAKDFARALVQGAVAAVGIALDVTGIALTSVDIYNGSLSPEAEKISNAASTMREEADVLEKVYESVSP